MIKRLPILLVCVAAVGCMPHFKSSDSYNAMFREPVPAQETDPYTFGGIAEGSGGTIARQTYPTDTQGPDPRAVSATGDAGYTGENRTRTPDPAKKGGSTEIVDSVHRTDGGEATPAPTTQPQ